MKKNKFTQSMLLCVVKHDTVRIDLEYMNNFKVTMIYKDEKQRDDAHKELAKGLNG